MSNQVAHDGAGGVGCWPPPREGEVDLLMIEKKRNNSSSSSSTVIIEIIMIDVRRVT